MDARIPESALRQIQQALAAGNKIEAIKLYREATGAGLADAKQAVESMASGIPGAAHSGGAPPSRIQMDEVRQALFAGRKIEAIKRYRDSTGKGSAEAKEEVEQLEAELRRAEPHRFPASPVRRGCGLMAFLLVGLMAATLAGLFLMRVQATFSNRPPTPVPVTSSR